RAARLRESRFARRLIDGEPFGVHELGVLESDEREDLAQPGRLGVRLAAVTAASRDEHVSLLAGDEPLPPGLRVAERDARAHDVIEPRLKLGRHTKVVHRYGKND